MLQPLADAVGATIERLRAKEALGESERRYHSLFATAREAIFISDDNLRYVEVNQAACDLLGYSRAELQALTVPGVMVAAAEAHKSWQTFIADGVQEGEATLRGKDGRLIPVEYRAVANFTPGRHFSVIRDMSERKRYERELREAEHRYRALFEQAHDAVFILDLHGRHLVTQTHDAVFILDLDCRLLQCNQQAADLLGYELAEMHDLAGLSVSTDPENSRRIHQRLLDGEHIPIYERQYRRKDGRIITVEVSAELVRDADGKPAHIQNIVRDITERKEIERALRDSESRLRSYIEHAPYGLFIADENGRYLEVNPAACAVTGYDESELLNMQVGDLHLPADYAAVQGHFEQVQKMVLPSANLPSSINRAKDVIGG
jgi:PAS domain S-box-containing protein